MAIINVPDKKCPGEAILYIKASLLPFLKPQLIYLFTYLFISLFIYLFIYLKSFQSPFYFLVLVNTLKVLSYVQQGLVEILAKHLYNEI